jgi:hypothetical protein
MEMTGLPAAASEEKVAAPVSRPEDEETKPPSVAPLLVTEREVLFSTAAGSAQRQNGRLADVPRAGATPLHALFATTRREGRFGMRGYRSHHDFMRSEDMRGTSANRGDSDDY